VAPTFCHPRAVARRLLHLPPPDPLATDYQLGKYLKHTTPNAIYPVQSIFNTASTQAYETYVVTPLAAGAVEVDARGRINALWAAGKDVGLRFEHGRLVAPTDKRWCSPPTQGFVHPSWTEIEVTQGDSAELPRGGAGVLQAVGVSTLRLARSRRVVFPPRRSSSHRIRGCFRGRAGSAPLRGGWASRIQRRLDRDSLPWLRPLRLHRSQPEG
jgi:hypothetical protein